MAVTINTDKTYTLDGVTYTAISDAVLNTDDSGKISGIASGSVTAVATDATNSPIVTFDATDEAIDFTATGNGEVITVTTLFPIELISGEFTYKGNKMTADASVKLAIVGTRGEYSLRNENTFESGVTYTFTSTALITESQHSTGTYTLTNGTDIRTLSLESSGKVINNFAVRGFTLTKGASEVINIGDYKLTATANNDAALNLELNENGVTLIPTTGDGTLNVVLTRGDTTIIEGELECTSGEITFGFDKAVTFAAGTSFNFTWNDYVTTVSTTAEATTDIALTNSGLSFTPHDGDGALNIVITKSNNPVFGGALNVTGGTITFDSTTQKISFTKGTNISLARPNGQQIDFKVVNDDAAIKVEADGAGNFTITPDTSDGSLDITLTGTSSGSLSANIEILSGGFLFGTSGALSVMENTELKIDFGNGYIVNFKATDAAGGAIALGEDGITFAPGSDDGGLKLSITQNGETRSASLDVTGSVTYKLDGSISLTKGTVVKNVFEDGETLTITANSDASGSIAFTPESGLSVTPATPDAFSLSLANATKGRTLYLTEITGTATYKGGSLILADGTSLVGSYDAQASLGGTTFKSEGGEGILRITSDGLTLISEDGARVSVVNERNHGCYLNDGKATLKASTSLFSISEGSNVEISNPRFPVVLESAGNYTLNGMNVTTSADNVEVMLNDYDTVTLTQDAEINLATTLSGSPLDVTAKATQGQASVTLDDDGNITYDATDATLEVTIGLEAVIGESILPNTFTISGGSITMGATDADGLKSISIEAGTEISFTQNGMTFKGVVQNDIDGRLWLREGVVLYLHSYDDAIFDTTILSNDNKIFNGMVTLSGAFSYSAERGTVGLVDSNTYNVHDSSIQLAVGNQSLKLTTAGDTFFAVLNVDDDSGKMIFDFNNEKYSKMLISAGVGGKDILDATLIVNGSIVVDPATQEISLIKDTALTFTQGDNVVKITALEDAGGKFSFVENGISFAPNAGDGALELNFVTSERKVDLNITGAVIFGDDGKISLESGTEADLTWEDGAKLTLTASDTGGSIGFDEQGLKISSAGELSIDLTTATGVQTTLLNLEGSIHYNAGKVLFDENSTLTATSSLGGQPTNLTLESNGTGGYVEISANGTKYVAGTGALQVTWSRDDKRSTFAINSGSVFIGHGIFEIAEGTSLSTDLQDLVPALYFTTSEAGTYTINGQTITTSEENISMTATDDYMAFTTSDGVITYDDMDFAGAGKVSLSSGGVVLGAGVEATGFGLDKSFVLAETGNVTADARIFELTEDVPTGITVTGTQDGFIFSRTNTEESEARFDEPDPANIGKIFTEEFSLTNDNAYRIQTDLLGLQQVIGVAAPATIAGSASFGGEPEETVFDVLTETEGEFTVGEKTYTISGDSSVAIMVDFEPNKSYVRGFKDLSGTVSGDFSDHAVTVNGTALAAKAGDTIVGVDNKRAYIYGANSELITADMSTEEIISVMTGGDSSNVTVASGKDNISLSGGGDLVIVEDTSAKVNITASKGNDTIVSKGENVHIKLNGTGKTDLFATGGKMTLEGYNAATGTGFGTNYENIFTAIENDAIDFCKGKLTLDSAVISFDKNSEVVNFYDADGDLQKVGYVSGEDSFNLSKEKANLILFAEESSTITSGAGNDSIYPDVSSRTDAGAGKNYIELETNRAPNAEGATILLSKGENTIANFKSGFDYESDRILFNPRSASNSFDGENLSIKSSAASAILQNVSSENGFIKILAIDSSGKEIKTAIAQEGATIALGDDTADIYVGKKSGVDFSGYDETLALDLNENFYGINQITVGGGLNTLIGSSANETLTGNNDGITEFNFRAGGGHDVISNFNFDEDTINISKGAVTDVKLTDEGGVRLQVGGGSDFLTIENAQGKIFNINDFVAKVDSNIDFDDTANYFVATGRNATLTVGDDVEGDAIIWLDNPDRNGSVFKGDIRTLDASNATVKTELAGNDLDNVILAGDGDASLWGGNGGDDLLVGGAGENIFFYTDGNDVISNVNDGDKIILSGIALENITGADFTDSAVAVKFSDGGTLTVNEAGKAVDFVVGEQTFVINDEHSGFIEK